MKNLELNKIGHKIGSVMVWTIEGAVEAYKTAVKKLLNENFTMEANEYLDDCERKLHFLGFTWEEIESFQIEALQQRKKTNS